MPTRQLPPLILHPFSDDPSGPSKLLDASRASLALQGLLPADDLSPEALEETLLEGRYCELRMLYYLGKDLLRWISQCYELFPADGVRPESFAVLLVEDPPAEVQRKLCNWGVHDFKNIFGRALGVHAVFACLPEREFLAPDFLRYYYRFADHIFACWQRLFPFKRVSRAEFDFRLYASGEYARLLERQWDST